jgi:hypothetical protein
MNSMTMTYDTSLTPYIVYRLADMSAREVGALVHNMKYGAKVKELVQHLPYLTVDTFIQPITR